MSPLRNTKPYRRILRTLALRCVSRGGEKYLPQTVVLKLNGGLGTSMGLDKAKSLLPVKGEDSFLDLTAKQVYALQCHCYCC